MRLKRLPLLLAEGWRPVDLVVSCAKLAFVVELDKGQFKPVMFPDCLTRWRNFSLPRIDARNDRCLKIALGCWNG